uniref:NADH-plastoquinone oxidoreductase subunit 7 n=1 Tax=Selaginella doederleinii TaxID=186426 RepID=A0A482CM13_9TRAC|nr:NADH-plastoquinone oxidoreductase subunit 7 [Selaginella doederleinii]QBL76071.1 NADH-plastoquinone oxidoreductase subunit 7 [Selaginella doederleinii]
MTVPTERGNTTVVSMGPHHPSMHGVPRLIATPDGEDVIDCEPVSGYLHRGMEKIAENRTIVQYPPYVTRWDYLATMPTEAVTVNAPERSIDIQAPKRASHTRIIMPELSRIAPHSSWPGPFTADIGAQTPFSRIPREREMVYDPSEAATGMRMTHNHSRAGGVAVDLPYGRVDKRLDPRDYSPPRVDEHERPITRNPIFSKRVEGVGIASGEEAINWGSSGPMLRASGARRDLRKVDHHECHDELDRRGAWQKEGDPLARHLVRIGEMIESVGITQQASRFTPGGPYENLEARRPKMNSMEDWNNFEYRFLSKKPSPTPRSPKREHYVRVEAPKGELGISLMGDDSISPWRWKIRPPCSINPQILPQLVEGTKSADTMTIPGSIDITMGEADR